MCSLIQFPGLNGIAVGLSLLCVMGLVAWLSLEKGPFLMDPHGKAGAFLPLFSIYLDIAKFVIGLASGSIALLVGSAIFRSNGGAGPLLASFASPLFLLAQSLICGVFFMAYLATDYEAYRHNETPYTRFKYSRNLAFGYSCLFCFALGYFWLICVVIRNQAAK